MAMYSPTEQQVASPPSTAVFTPIKRQYEQGICTNLIDFCLLDVQDKKLDADSFTVYLSSLDPTLKHLLGNLLEQDIDIEFWLAAFQYGTLVGTSDGSVKNGQGPVDCHPSLLQSYRAELTGILAVYCILKCMRKYSKEEFLLE
eukprot:15176855-Ditylum_brightwellii.AAC.1